LKSLTNFENADRNPPQNFLLCGWSVFSSAILSLTARENAQELTCNTRRYVLQTMHRQLPVCILSVKITALVHGFEGFSNLVSHFKEQAKTLSLIFSSTMKQTIVKTLSTCTESTYLLL
jgi:hypothetical protein